MATKLTKKKTTRAVTSKAAAIAATAIEDAKVPHEKKRITVARTDLHPGVAQYRTFFDPKKIDELAASMKLLGQLDPLHVRKRAKGGYELVGGERRWRAAKIAGIAKLECELHDYTDQQAREAAIGMNLHNEKPTPLEECDAFVALQERCGYTVEQIAARVHHPIGYVYERIALRELCEAARKAMADGTIGLGVARLVSRVRPEKSQTECVKEILRDRRGDAPITISDARRIVEGGYMLRLVSAPFDIRDPKLTSAGSCETCPNNSETQGSLFPNQVDEHAQCTNRPCWDRKVRQHGLNLVATAKERGKRMLPSAEVKELLPYGPSSGVHSREYIQLDQAVGSKTWRTILGDRLTDDRVTVAPLPSGEVVELARRSEVEKLVRDQPRPTDPANLFGHRASAEERAKSKAANAKRKREEAIRARAEDKVRDLIVKGVEAVMESEPDRHPDLLRVLVAIVVEQHELTGGAPLDRICARRGIAVDHGDRDEHANEVLLAHAAESTCEVPQLVGLLAELMTFGSGFRTEPIDRLAGYFRVDTKHAERDAQRELEEAEEEAAYRRKHGKPRPTIAETVAAEGAPPVKKRGRKSKSVLVPASEADAERVAEAFGQSPQEKHADPLAEPEGDDGEDW